ncbi:MAG TPA: hypothetical protein VK578_23765 [Edaphobacter sp.]|nr:hypothetical protein [Edaphobacter sp.]
MESVLEGSSYNGELQYVTQHFRELQGLQMVPFWMTAIVLSLLEYAHAVTRWQAVTLFLSLVALSIVLAAFVGRWYRRHYGFVAQREERLPSQLISITRTDQRIPKERSKWFVLSLFFVFALMFFPLLLHSYRNYSNFGLLTLIFFVLPKTSLDYARSTSLRRRQILAIGCGVALIIIQIFYDLGHLDRWAFVAASASVLMVGSLYDHWLLKRLLGGPLLEGHHA